MPKEPQVCRACGAPPEGDSLFCRSCGRPFAGRWETEEGAEPTADETPPPPPPRERPAAFYAALWLAPALLITAFGALAAFALDVTLTAGAVLGVTLAVLGASAAAAGLLARRRLRKAAPDERSAFLTWSRLFCAALAVCWLAVGGVTYARSLALLTLAGHRAPITRLACSLDGNLIASGDARGVITIWDVAAGASLQELHSAEREVRALAFSPSGFILASATDHPQGSEASLWRLATGDLQRVFHFELPTVAVAFVPEVEAVRFATIGEGRVVIHQWDAETEELTEPFEITGIRGDRLALAPNGRFLAVDEPPAPGEAGGDRLAIWDLTERRRIQRLPGTGSTSGERTLLFSPDGQMLLVLEPERVTAWDVQAGAQERQLDHDPELGSIRDVSLDGARALTLLPRADARSEVSIVYLPDERREHRLRMRDFSAEQLLLVPDNRTTVLAEGNRLRLWRWGR